MVMELAQAEGEIAVRRRCRLNRTLPAEVTAKIRSLRPFANPSRADHSTGTAAHRTGAGAKGRYRLPTVQANAFVE